MPKTPEDVKKGLACLISEEELDDTCGGCVYLFTHSPCAEHILPDALALIQQLEARVPRWISVEERLPDRGVEVLGTNGKAVEMCTYWPGQPTPWESWTAFHFKPTHWMPLPEPPKEDLS